MKTTWALGVGVVMGVAALTAVAVRNGAPGSVPDPRAAIFVRHGCNDCHAVSALRLAARHDVAPDLTYASGDVVLRYGVDLETFLDNPSGVMRLMLGAHIQLNAAERDSIATILRGLYAQRVALRR